VRVQGEHVDHRAGQGRLDVVQPVDPDQVHRIPEPAVVEGTRRDLGDPAQGGGGPPAAERPFGAGIADPVQCSQRQVGAGRGPAADRRDAQHRVDHIDHVQLLEHRPDRRDVPEPAVLGLGQVGLGARAGRQPGDHLRLGAEVDLLHDPRLPIDTGAGGRIQVGVSPQPLLDDRGHNYR
jgi:hypothetical protein